MSLHRLCLAILLLAHLCLGCASAVTSTSGEPDAGADVMLRAPDRIGARPDHVDAAVAVDAISVTDTAPLADAPRAGPGCTVDGWCWSNPRPQGNPLHAVWGSATNDVWAVGQPINSGSGGRVLHWDGRAWSATALPGQTTFVDVWASGPNDVWVVSMSGAILHGDGRTWTDVTQGNTRRLHALWGSGPSDVWAVGVGGTILHWNGTRWSRSESW